MVGMGGVEVDMVVRDSVQAADDDHRNAAGEGKPIWLNLLMPEKNV